MKANEKKMLKSIIRQLAELSDEYQSRIDEYEENDKEETSSYEKCTDEKDSIDYAAQELCDLIECNFDEFTCQ